MAEYLDKTHLQYYTTKLVDKLKTLFVPSTRKVNNKALSSDITLEATDVLSSAQQDAVNSGVTSSDVTKLSGIESGAEANVQANWNEADSSSDAYIQNKPAIPPEMTILSYGHSTWADFIACYNTKTVVYCRASSNSNPGTGSQNRLAFMAYVNNDSAPTEVEFQYYRSVATHSDSQQGDQVYVYKLNKNNGWSVTVRSAFTKIVAGSGLTSSYNNGVLTISLS